VAVPVLPVKVIDVEVVVAAPLGENDEVEDPLCPFVAITY
jgi:hypothetical protein